MAETVGERIRGVNCITTATGQKYEFAEDFRACLAAALPGLWDAKVGSALDGEVGIAVWRIPKEGKNG